MATPAPRHIEGLNIAFDYDVEPARGDRVKVIAGRKVEKITAIGDPCEVGEVLSVRNSLKECVVATKYRKNRQDRIAGEAVDPGLMAFGTDNAIFQYTPASPARHDGTTTGPKTVTVDTDDTIKVTLENGADQTIVITAGVGLTFAAIAAEINATLTGMTVVVNTAGNLCLVANEIGKAITIGAVATDAYTLLGWTAATYAPTNASHDPSACKGMILVGGAAAAAVETLED